MATRGVAMTATYVAWNTASNRGQTGDAAQHALRWVKDGASAAPTNSPSEVDAASAPGVYKLALTAAETNANLGTLCGKSGTAHVEIVPVLLQFERLPDAPPGTAGGLPTASADNGVTIAAFVPVAASLLVDAIWDEARSGHEAPGSFGWYLDAAVSGVVAGVGGGSAAAGGYLANLLVARDNLALQLADLTANPKPTYTLDGQTVDWDTHFTTLAQRLDELNRAIDAAEPFEIHTTGYTP